MSVETLTTNIICQQTEEKIPEELITQAVNIHQKINKTHKEIIESKFQLGKIVYEIIQSRKYGENAVSKFAEEISKRLNKIISPQRLYEAARLYSTFQGDIQKIWELEKVFPVPLTYSLIIKKCIPYINEKNAWTPEEIALYIEKKLNDWEESTTDIENNIQKIKKLEKIVNNSSNKQVEGFEIAFNQSHETSKFVFSNHLKKFISAVEQAIIRDIQLTQKDLELIDTLIAKLLLISGKKSLLITNN